MSVDLVFLDFSETMTQICLYQRTVKSQTDLELKELFEEKETRSKRSIFSEFRSVNKMYFHHALSGQLDVFGGETQTIDQCICSVIAHKNKQYQWLIAEAYEEFDKFLTHTYVFLGIEQFDLWPLSDYLNNRLPDVKSMKWTARLELLKNKKSVVSHILLQLRTFFPSFNKAENSNSLKINFKVFIITLQKFRHHIVHNGGYINNHEDLINKILNEASVNGKTRAAQESFIRSYIDVRDGRSLVNLLEVTSDVYPLSGIGSYYDPCDEILKLLVSYAHLIKSITATEPTTNNIKN